jgi:hypothetical protein
VSDAVVAVAPLPNQRPCPDPVPRVLCCEAVCYCARMSWTLPTPLLLFAGAIALLPPAAIVRRLTSTPRLVQTFLTALAIIALVWLAWVALWLIEQRW